MADYGPVEATGWTRRQLIARGGVAGALLLLGRRVLSALVDVSPEPSLSDQRKSVVVALASASRIAAGVSPAAARAVADAIAAGHIGLDDSVRAGINAILDAIEVAPSPGAFSKLDDGQRQALMRGAVRVGVTPVPAGLALTGESDLLYQGYVAEAQAGTLDDEPGDYPGDPPDQDGEGSPPLASSPPPPTAPTPAQQLRLTVFVALVLVDDPPPPTGDPTGPHADQDPNAEVMPAFSPTMLAAIANWSS